MPPAPHRRAEPYLALHPERGHGYRVDDPPPPGWTRTVAVARIEEWSRLGSRAAYRVGYARLLRRGPVLRDGPVRTTFVVVERQPDGRWLVAAQRTSPTSNRRLTSNIGAGSCECGADRTDDSGRVSRSASTSCDSPRLP